MMNLLTFYNLLHRKHGNSSHLQMVKRKEGDDITPKLSTIGRNETSNWHGNELVLMMNINQFRSSYRTNHLFGFDFQVEFVRLPQCKRGL